MNDIVKTYDVLILGAGIGGSLVAINLLRKHPELRIALIEKSVEFEQKLGESSSDITGMIFRRSGLDHILQQQPEKTGLRFLFTPADDFQLRDVKEFSSPAIRSAINGYQFNRKKLDQDLLDEAVELGAIVVRPAEVVSWKHESFQNEVECLVQNNRVKFFSKWVIDAAGRARLTKKFLGWKDIPVIHRTGTVYAHYQNIVKPAEWKIATSDYWNNYAIGSSDFSTIHFMRPHGWWWFIRIDEMTTSVGFVYDLSKYQADNPSTFFEEQVEACPALAHILQNAKRTEVKQITQLAHCSEKLAGQGIALLGDSASFVDPLVSPGIELILQQQIQITEALLKEFETGTYPVKLWNRYNREFKRACLDRVLIYSLGYQFMNSYTVQRTWLRLGFLGYFGIFIYLKLVGITRLSKPLMLNAVTRAGLQFVAWRLNRVYLREQKKSRVGDQLKLESSRSFVFVSHGIKRHFIPFRMFALFWLDLFRLEFYNLRLLFRK